MQRKPNRVLTDKLNPCAHLITPSCWHDGNLTSSRQASQLRAALALVVTVARAALLPVLRQAEGAAGVPLVLPPALPQQLFPLPLSSLAVAVMIPADIWILHFTFWVRGKAHKRPKSSTWDNMGLQTG